MRNFILKRWLKTDKGDYVMKMIALATAIGVGLFIAGPAEAGCLKGALVGGIAGHLVGHGAVGAAAGCAYGANRASKARMQSQDGDTMNPGRGSSANQSR